MTVENSAVFVRLFIAIPVPLAVREEISRAQSQLQRNSPPGIIRWTRSEQFHVTIKFLGDVQSEQVQALAKAVFLVCSKFPKLQLSAHGIGFFPGSQRPRIVWAGVADKSGKLRELHREMEQAVLPFGPAKAEESFTGHITLGRFKPGHRGSTDKLLERVAILNRRDFGNWNASEVEIVRSELTSLGATHTPMYTFPLTYG